MNINEFKNIFYLPGPQDQTVVRPNVDTFYSLAWIDLSNGPITISIPESKDRYYMMPILDAWTNVIFSIGTRTTGN